MNTDLQKFDEIKANISLYVSPVKDLKVIDRTTSADASQTFATLSDWEKKVEAKRKELVGPLNDQVKRINEYVKTIVEPITGAKKHLNDQLVAFERILEAERQEKLRLEREEHLKKQREAELAAQKAREDAEVAAKLAREEAEVAAMFDGKSEEETKAEAEKAAALEKQKAEAEAQRIVFENQKNHWDAKKEIMSDKVAGTRRSWKGEVVNDFIVPREYLSVDQVKINAAIRAGAREIPGVRIFEDLTITSRR